MVYFAQGGSSLAAIAFPLLLRGKGWGISEIAFYSFLIGLPWTLKIAYGALSDTLPILGYQRKPYLILASLVSACSWLALAILPVRKDLLLVLGILSNLGFAITDVVCDAVIVENSNGANAPIYQSIAWGFRALGAILGGVSGGWLVERVSYRIVFLITALLPLAIFVAGCFLQEARREETSHFRDVWKPVVNGLQSILSGNLGWFCLLLIASSLSGSFSTPFFFFLREGLGFEETFLGALSSFGWLGAIAGCFVYARLFRTVSFKTALRLGLAFSISNAMFACLVRNSMSALILSLAGGVIGYMSFLPLIAAATTLSHRSGMEGSLFALLMSVYNLGQLASGFVGGKLFDIIGLDALIVVSVVSPLIGFIFINKLEFE